MSDNPQATALLTAWMRGQEEINKEVASQLNRLDIELTAANALIAEFKLEALNQSAKTDTQPDTFNAKR